MQSTSSWNNHPHILQDPGEMTDRWSDSYIGVGIEGKVQPLHVIQFVKSKEVYRVKGVLLDNGTTREMTADVESLVFEKPVGGLINFDESVFFTTYIPNRQWKRGYRYRNISLVRPFADEEAVAGARGRNALTNDPRFIEAFFMPTYPSPRAAIAQVRSLDVLARAFSRKFAVGIKDGYPDLQLFYKYHHVGRITDNDTVLLNENSEQLIEELSQYLPCEVVRKSVRQRS